MRKLLILAVLLLTGCSIPYSEGDRVGQIYKLSYKGLLCKTWEGEMALPGINLGAEGGGNVFEFTINDPSVLPKLQVLISKGKPVRVHYQEVVLPLWCTTKSGYFVTSFSESDSSLPEVGRR